MRIPSTHAAIAFLVLLMPVPQAPAAPATTEEALPVDEAREAALLRAAGPGFKLKRTVHFLIAYDTTTELVESLTDRLETTYTSVYRFCEQAKIGTRKPDHALEVFFFNTRDTYAKYATRIRFDHDGTCGVYHEGSNRSAFFNIENDPQVLAMQANVLAARRNLDELTETLNAIRGSRTVVEIEYSDGRREQMTRREADRQVSKTRKSLADMDRRRTNLVRRLNQTVLQHETAHQVLHNAGVHVRGATNPAWITEGLACLFETPPGRTGAGLHVVNQLRLEDFREAVAAGRTSRKLSPDDVIEAIEDGRLVSPRDLILKPALLRRASDERATNYAVAWAMAAYLQRARKDQLPAYLREVGQRKPGERIRPEEELAVFEKHFGPLDDAFLKRFATCIVGLPVFGDGGP